jgi:ATP-dependent protease ClpP protease subunit
MNDYPQSAVNAAKKALKFKDDNSQMDCGTLVGWARANQIAKRENLSNKTIKRTYSFLSRAKTYDTGSFTDKDGKYVCGSIMYAAWGGNSMLTWAKKKTEEMNNNVIEINGGIGNFYNDAEYIDYKLNSFEDGSQDLEVYINSLGGSFVDAISIYHSLKKYKGKSKAIYNGLCASAATIIASGCDEIEMTDASAILIHKVMNFVDVYGHLNGDDLNDVIKELKKTKKNSDTLSSLAASIYAKKTGKSIDEMLKQMKSDSWILPNDALELGLIDNIIDTQKTKKAEQQINELIENKIQGLELVNNVSLPKLNLNKSNNDMNIKETITNFFKSNESKMTEKDAEILATSLSNEIESELSELRTKLEVLENKATANEAKDTTKITTELTNRVEKIESRDGQVAELLQGFVDGLNKSINQKLDEQETKIKNTITELQLKENSIVTGDSTFEGKTPTTDEWINQLSKFKNK